MLAESISDGYGNLRRDIRPRMESTNCSHILFLLLGLHHYIHQFFEVLWLLDGALERNITEKVMYGNFLGQVHLLQDLMYATMNMVGCKK